MKMVNMLLKSGLAALLCMPMVPFTVWAVDDSLGCNSFNQEVDDKSEVPDSSLLERYASASFKSEGEFEEVENKGLSSGEEAVSRDCSSEPVSVDAEETQEKVGSAIEQTESSGASLLDTEDGSLESVSSVNEMKAHSNEENFYPDSFLVREERLSEVPEGWVGIYSADDLAKIKDSGNYMLMDNIDLASWGNWEPLCYASYDGGGFRGVVDGNGYVIKGLSIDASAFQADAQSQYIGLFANLGYQGRIRNLGLKDVRIYVGPQQSTGYVGGLVAKCSNGGFGDTPIIDNCFVTGEITYEGNAVRSYVGGMTGEVGGFSSVDGLLHCCSSVRIMMAPSMRSDDMNYGSYCGGLTGALGCSTHSRGMKQCLNLGDIEAVGDRFATAGGVVGYGSDDFYKGSTVKECLNAGNVRAGGRAAGIIGSFGGNSSILDCENLGKIESAKTQGEAYAAGITTLAYLQSSMANCINIGDVHASSSDGEAYAMPLITLENGVGNNANGATNYYYSGITLAGQALGSYKGYALSEEQMRQQNSFEGFDFENVWKVEDNYPILRFIPQNFYDLIAGGEPENPPALEKATVRYNTEFELDEADGEWIDKSVELTWGDALFDRNATEYNHDLARLGIALSMMTYSEGRLVQASPNIKTAVEDGVTLQTDYSKASQTTRDESYSLSTLKGMGFSEANIRNYYYRDEQRVRDNDTCAYTLAYKTIKRNGKTVPLVMVLVRGTAANAEWVSNANVSNSNQTLDDYHEGFLLAASEIEVSLRKLMKDCEAESLDMSDAVYFVTGHSRGAAVANLVGAWLSGSDQSKTNDVFTYTFAAPKTVSKAQMGSKLYQNIFNIVNPEDVVAYVPLSKWGYSRYGRTMTLPSRSNSSNYNSELSGMNEQFSSATDGKSYKPYIDGTFSVTATANLLYALCGNVDSLYKTFYAFELESGVSRHTVASVLQSLLMVKYCGWDELSAKEKAASIEFTAIAATGVVKIGKDVVTLIGGLGLSAVFIAGGAVAVNVGGHIECAHTGETYLAWMMSSQNESVYKESNKSVLWACPVDVHVYDENGALVASIENDVADESVMVNGLAAYVTEEGEKYVHIPNDANCYFEVEATGEGAMDYVVSELDEDGEVERQVATYDVPLDLGKQYHGTLEAGSNEADSCALVDEAGEPVSVDSEYKASEASQSIVGVSVEGEGNAWGNAVVVPGAWATVHAEPLEGSSFKGWFEGDTLVSDQLDYRFRPERDTDLVAVFADSTDDPSEPSDNPQDPDSPSDDPANPSDKPGEPATPAEKDPNQDGGKNNSNNTGGLSGESNGSDKKQGNVSSLGEDSKKNDDNSGSIESAKEAVSKTALSQTGDQLPGAILASAFFALASLAGVMICLSWRRLRPA